jgi:hypothetical protein
VSQTGGNSRVMLESADFLSGFKCPVECQRSPNNLTTLKLHSISLSVHPILVRDQLVVELYLTLLPYKHCPFAAGS